MLAMKTAYSKTVTRLRLFALMSSPYPELSVFYDHRGRAHEGIIQAVEREDGSGRSFNVRICTRLGEQKTVYVRCSE